MMSPSDFLEEMARLATRQPPLLSTGSEGSEGDGEVPVFIGEFWTSGQRQGHSLHEISYRACFKPQLPAFFIERFTRPGDRVLDPFMGRGTTLIEAALRGRVAAGCDANPIAKVLTAPRLAPPSLSAIEERIQRADLTALSSAREDLLTFFHPETLQEIEGWRNWFRQRRREGTFDAVDAWIEMTATNRLTGHSPGFFSVYTLPPNQATSVKAQQRINARRNQQPEPRPTRPRILRKSRQLLQDALPGEFLWTGHEVVTCSAHRLDFLPANSVALVVTSPPFLDTVDYLQDNWLRMWFCGLEARKEEVWMLGQPGMWIQHMEMALREIERVLKPGGILAFEVGEVRKGTHLLEHDVLQAARATGLKPLAVLIHSQRFTKTANCWGVENNAKGTNTNRIVVMHKPE